MAGPLPPPGLVEIVLSPSYWSDPQPLPECPVGDDSTEYVLLSGDLMRFVERVEYPLLHDGYERVATLTEGPLPTSDMPIGMSTNRGDTTVLCVIEDHYSCYEPRIPDANFRDGRHFVQAQQELQENPLDPAAPIFALEVARWCSYGLESVVRRPYLTKTVTYGDSHGAATSILPFYAMGEHRQEQASQFVRVDSPALEIGVTYQERVADDWVSLRKIVQVDVFAPVERHG